MEVITMENEAYQKMMLKLDTLCDCFLSFAAAKEDVWRKLNISPRTLFRMKKERLISYSVLRGHCRFLSDDVERLMRERSVVTDPETFEELRQSYPAFKK